MISCIITWIYSSLISLYFKTSHIQPWSLVSVVVPADHHWPPTSGKQNEVGIILSCPRLCSLHCLTSQQRKKANIFGKPNQKNLKILQSLEVHSPKTNSGTDDSNLKLLLVSPFKYNIHPLQPRMTFSVIVENNMILMLSHLMMYHMTYPIPDNKVHGANMGPIWGRQDPGGPHVRPMNFDIWDIL